MAPIDVDQIKTDLVTYADFEEQGSVSRAKSFVTAAKRWLVLTPQMAGSDGRTLTMSHSEVSKLLTRAQNYVDANDTASSGTSKVRHFSFENDFR